MELESITEILDSEDGCIKLNSNLIKAVGIEAALLYSYFVSKQVLISKGLPYKEFSGVKYFLCTVEDVQDDISLSAFRQRAAIAELMKKKLVHVKLGQARARYVNVVGNPAALQKLLFAKHSDEIDIRKLRNFVRHNITAQKQLFENYQKVQIKEDYFYEHYLHFLTKELDARKKLYYNSVSLNGLPQNKFINILPWEDSLEKDESIEECYLK